MQREIDLKDISDGKLYQKNDMVKAGCDDCKGCSACCREMGESILLDPMDIWRFCVNLECSFDELLQTCLELHVVDGIIIPNMKMVGEKEQCAFLNEEGRCNVHGIRPGICRLFPLGRLYENGGLSYFLQTHECKKEGKTKVKIKKWLEIPELEQYEQYICHWHYFQKDVGRILENMNSDAMKKRVNLYLLELFYRTAYEKEDFYGQFYNRLEEAKKYVGIA